MMFEIRYGLGGGFGGAGDWEDCEAKDIDDACDYAYQAACEYYEQYDGMHGLSSTEDIAEEYPDYDEESLEMEWRERRESWLDYEARKKEEKA